MIYTAVDWSGDPGIPSKTSASSQTIVFAFVTIQSEDRTQLHAALESARRTHQKSDRFVFHFVDCPNEIAATFFQLMRSVELHIRIGLIEKRKEWSSPAFSRLKGEQRLLDSLVGYSIQIPEVVSNGGTLLIDAPRTEKKFAVHARRSIRGAFAPLERECFQEIRLCPDGNDPDGEIIQVADMVAGAVRRAGTMNNPYIRVLGRRIVDWDIR